MVTQKENITTGEIARELFDLCWECSKEFSKTFKPEAEKAGFKFDSATDVRLIREIIMMDMWLASKALSSDKVILDGLHKIYLSGHSNMATTDEARMKFPRVAEDELNERYKKYYEAWDDNAKGNQQILATKMLEYLLNKGEPVDKLNNVMLNFMVNIQILDTIVLFLQFMKDVKNKFEIK